MEPEELMAIALSNPGGRDNLRLKEKIAAILRATEKRQTQTSWGRLMNALTLDYLTDEDQQTYLETNDGTRNPDGR